MDSNVLIVLVIVLGVVLIVFLLRDRITGLRTRASLEKREGEFELKAAKPQSPSAARSPKTQPPDPHSVNISGNVGLGRTKINVQRDDVAIKDNKLVGDSEIDVDQSGVKKSGK